MPHIDFLSHEISFNLSGKKKIRTWIERVILSHRKFPDNLQYIFCSDEYLAEMNKNFLNHDTLTDIITFNYNSGHYLSGDIFISLERVSENAVKYNSTFNEELLRVMIHGILHLLEFNDKSPAQFKNMRKAENDALALFENL